MLVEVQTPEGPAKVRVCDYCRAVCCTGRFCSSRCYWQNEEAERILAQQKQESPNPQNSPRDGS